MGAALSTIISAVKKVREWARRDATAFKYLSEIILGSTWFNALNEATIYLKVNNWFFFIITSINLLGINLGIWFLLGYIFSVFEVSDSNLQRRFKWHTALFFSGAVLYCFFFIPSLFHIFIPFGLYFVQWYYFTEYLAGRTTSRDQWFWEVPGGKENRQWAMLHNQEMYRLQAEERERRREKEAQDRKKAPGYSEPAEIWAWSEVWCRQVEAASKELHDHWEKQEQKDKEGRALYEQIARQEGRSRSGFWLAHLAEFINICDRPFVRPVMWRLENGRRVIYNGFRESDMRELPNWRNTANTLYTFSCSVTRPEQIAAALFYIREAYTRVTCYGTGFIASNRSHGQFERSFAIKCELRRYPPEFERGKAKAINIDPPELKRKFFGTARGVYPDPEEEYRFVQKDRHLVNLISIAVDRYVVVTFHILHMLENPTEDTVTELEKLFDFIFDRQWIKVGYNIQEEIAALDATLEHMYRQHPRRSFQEQGHMSQDLVRRPAYKDIGPPNFYTRFARPLHLEFRRGEHNECPYGFHSNGVDYNDRACPCNFNYIDITAILDFILRQYEFHPTIPHVIDEEGKVVRTPHRRDNWARVYPNVGFEKIEQWMLAGDRYIPLLTTMKARYRKEPSPLNLDQSRSAIECELATLRYQEEVKTYEKTKVVVSKWKYNEYHDSLLHDDEVLSNIYGDVLSLSIIVRTLMTCETDRLLAERLINYGTQAEFDTKLECFETVLHRPVPRPRFIRYDQSSFQYAIPIVDDAQERIIDSYDRSYYDEGIEEWLDATGTNNTVGFPLNEAIKTELARCRYVNCYNPQREVQQGPVSARQLMIRCFMTFIGQRYFDSEQDTPNAWYCRFLFAQIFSQSGKYHPTEAELPDFAEWEAFWWNERDWDVDCAALCSHENEKNMREVERRGWKHWEPIQADDDYDGGTYFTDTLMDSAFAEFLLRYLVQVVAEFEELDGCRLRGYNIYENAWEYRKLTGNSIWEVDDIEKVLKGYGFHASKAPKYKVPWWFPRLQARLGTVFVNRLLLDDAERQSRDLQDFGVEKTSHLVDRLLGEVQAFVHMADFYQHLNSVSAICLARERKKRLIYTAFKFFKELGTILGLASDSFIWLSSKFILFSAVCYWLKHFFTTPRWGLAPVVVFLLICTHNIPPIINRLTIYLAPIFTELYYISTSKQKPTLLPEEVVALGNDTFNPIQGLWKYKKNKHVKRTPEEREQQKRIDNEARVAEVQKVEAAKNWSPPRWLIYLSSKSFKTQEDLPVEPDMFASQSKRWLMAVYFLLSDNPQYKPDSMLLWPTELHVQTARLMDQSCTEFTLPAMNVAGSTGCPSWAHWNNETVQDRIESRKWRRHRGRRSYNFWRDPERLKEMNPFGIKSNDTTLSDLIKEAQARDVDPVTLMMSRRQNKAVSQTNTGFGDENGDNEWERNQEQGGTEARTGAANDYIDVSEVEYSPGRRSFDDDDNDEVYEYGENVPDEPEETYYDEEEDYEQDYSAYRPPLDDIPEEGEDGLLPKGREEEEEDEIDDRHNDAKWGPRDPEEEEERAQYRANHGPRAGTIPAWDQLLD